MPVRVDQTLPTATTWAFRLSQLMAGDRRWHLGSPVRAVDDRMREGGVVWGAGAPLEVLSWSSAFRKKQTRDDRDDIGKVLHIPVAGGSVQFKGT